MYLKVDIGEFGSGTATVTVHMLAEWQRVKPDWRVVLVTEMPKDRRRKAITHAVNTDDYGYRRLDTDARVQFEREFFRNLLGEDRYNQALLKAWEMCRPEV